MRASAGMIATLAVLIAVAAGQARAQSGALVEEVGEAPDGIAAMDRLAPGRIVALHSGERLVLDYFASCVRETIVGGTVVIGADHSSVTDGAISRETVECNGGKLAVTGNRGAVGSGALVIRAPPRRTNSGAAQN